MTEADTSPLDLEFRVRCERAHAFRTWTEDFGRWWPRSHVMSDDPDVAVILEPEVAGRIYERTSSGAELDWGVIVAWEPPRRLAFRWHLMFDVSEATDVEITFESIGPNETAVRIVHGGWDRLGEAGPVRRDRNTAGWTGVFDDFRRAAEHDRAVD